jgi:hypothetical protein
MTCHGTIALLCCLLWLGVMCGAPACAVPAVQIKGWRQEGAALSQVCWDLHGLQQGKLKLAQVRAGH